MRFVADESVDSAIVERLRRDGHEGLYVAETQPGIADEAVLELANRDGAVLLTADKDFGELVFRQRQLDSGVVLLRLAGLSEEAKAREVAAAVAAHDDEMGHAFSVVSPGLVRIRRSHRSESSFVVCSASAVALVSPVSGAATTERPAFVNKILFRCFLRRSQLAPGSPTMESCAQVL